MIVAFTDRASRTVGILLFPSDPSILSCESCVAFACSVPRKGTGADIQSVNKVVGFCTECNAIERKIVFLRRSELSKAPHMSLYFKSWFKELAAKQHSFAKS